MNNEAEFRLTKAVISLIRLQPFYGVLAMRLDRVADANLRFKTLATDGEKLYYDPGWVMAQSPDVLESGVAHEVVHCALQHMYRRGARNPMRWNQAIDYATNWMLHESGFTIPGGWLINPQFAGLSAEQIYNLLPDEEEDEEGGGQGPGGISFDGHMDAPATEEAANDWEVATLQAAEQQRKAEQGTLPASIERLLKRITAPKVDWRSVLQRFARGGAKDDFSWVRPNRAYMSLGLILPGLYSETVEDVTTVIDTSGSITDEILAAFGSEIGDIHATVSPVTLRSMYCDADVNHVDEFDPHDQFFVKPHGGGGTDFRPPFAWLEAHDKQPTCLIYLTDGYGPFPAAAPSYPVLWVMTTDVVPPWGEHVRIEL